MSPSPKSNILKTLASPSLISLATAVIIIIAFKIDYPKYRAAVTDIESILENPYNFFSDIDQNGYSDRIFVVSNSIGTSGLAVKFFPSEFTLQWNFRGNYDFISNSFVSTGDADQDGFEEISLATVVGDSVLLHIIGGYPSLHPILENRFIATLGSKESKTDADIRFAAMEDLNGDGSKELIFMINSGFGLTPRNLYCYDILKDSLAVSPYFGMSAGSIQQGDLTGDGISEFTLCGYASDNLHSDTMSIHDQSSWLWVFTGMARPLFPPVENPGIFGAVNARFIPSSDP